MTWTATSSLMSSRARAADSVVFPAPDLPSIATTPVGLRVCGGLAMRTVARDRINPGACAQETRMEPLGVREGDVLSGLWEDPRES